MNDQGFTAQSALQYGFSKYREESGRCFAFFLGVELICLLAAASLAFNMTIAAQLITQLDSAPPDTFFYIFIPLYLAIRTAAQVLVNKWLLMMFDGRDVTVDELLGFDFGYSFPLIVKQIAASFVYTTYAILGTLILVVPGLFALSTLRFYKFLIADKDADAFEAVGGSYDLARNSKSELVSLTVMTAFVRLFGMALIVGLIPANAICGFAEAYAYKQLQRLSEEEQAAHKASLN